MMKRELHPHIWPTNPEMAAKHGLDSHLNAEEEKEVHAHLDNYDAFCEAYQKHAKAEEHWRKAFHEQSTIVGKLQRGIRLGVKERFRLSYVQVETKELFKQLNEHAELKENALYKMKESHKKIHHIVKRIHGDNAVHPDGLHPIAS